MGIRPGTALAAALVLAGVPGVGAQQVADRDFRPPIARPLHAEGAGPVVCVDEAHANFHTLGGRFWAFGALIRRDGFVPRALREKADRRALAPCAILVVANAQPSEAAWDSYPSPTPSAFSPAEVQAVRDWVGRGGRLLLIADHMPLAGAATALAAAFGVRFTDGFAVEAFEGDTGRARAFAEPTIFRTADGTLRPHAIVRGRDAADSVTSVRSFTGQAFRAPASAEPILVLPSTFVSLMPAKAWRFDSTTRRVPAGGWLQGAVMRVGAGRAAFFGEAAMFTAQRAGAEGRPMGMNAPGAEQNARFVLNVMHWLAGAL